jgi:hypothetical protein
VDIIYLRLDSVSFVRWYILRWAQYTALVFVTGPVYLLGLNEYVPPDDGDRILNAKCCVLNNRTMKKAFVRS